jgi:hypothetical protein
MMNGEAIAAQVQQGAFPAHWQVWHARASHFIRLAILSAIILIGAAIGIMYLLNNPNQAFTIGAVGSPDTGSLDPSAFSNWRVADFVILGFFLLFCAGYLVFLLAQSVQAKEQVLVLFPEGFVLKTGQTRAFAFANIRSISASSYRGVVNLRIVASDGRKFSVRIDGRFGKAKPLAQRILAARNQFPARPS